MTLSPIDRPHYGAICAFFGVVVGGLIALAITALSFAVVEGGSPTNLWLVDQQRLLLVAGVILGPDAADTIARQPRGHCSTFVAALGFTAVRRWTERLIGCSKPGVVVVAYWRRRAHRLVGGCLDVGRQRSFIAPHTHHAHAQRDSAIQRIRAFLGLFKVQVAGVDGTAADDAPMPLSSTAIQRAFTVSHVDRLPEAMMEQPAPGRA